MNKFHVDPTIQIVNPEEFPIKKAFHDAHENVKSSFHSQAEMHSAYGYFLAGWQAAQRHKPVAARLHPVEGERSDDLGPIASHDHGIVDYN